MTIWSANSRDSALEREFRVRRSLASSRANHLAREDAIEHGSGSTALKQLTEQLVSDSEFTGEQERAAAKDSVKLRDKERFYYRMFRTQLPLPIERARDVKTCPACDGPVSISTELTDQTHFVWTL
jgi:hypothetical protein